MNYSKLFYWLTVADNARGFFLTFTIIFTIIAIISTLCFLFGRDGNDLECPKDGLAERAKKWMWYGYPFMILFWSLFIFTPSKRDALLIVAGGETLNYLTTDSTARQIPKELSSFVVSELKNMASEAKVELESNSQKSKILDEAKLMTTEDIIKKMKLDSNFKNIVLNN